MSLDHDNDERDSLSKKSLENNITDEVSGSVKRRTVVGPWKNVSEFNKVYNWIYGPENTPQTRHKALSIIQVWSLRRSTLCPAAVLATSVIVEVQLKDGPETKFTEDELQVFYSSAFTRFFNFMSSIMQSHNMKTMYETAQELGLQSFVVDLRHICAHGQVLPPLLVLRKTAEYCLSWLRGYYWESQRNIMCNIDAAHIRRTDKTEFDENISKLFNIYDAALEGYMKGATDLKTLKRHLHGNRFNCLKEFYLTNKLTSVLAAFDVIVRNLCAHVRRDIAIKDMVEIYIEAFIRMKYFFTLHQDLLKDDEIVSLMSVTQTLFRMLAVYGFVEELFLSLIEITENPIAKPSKRTSASFWAVKIAEGFRVYHQCKKMYKTELDAGSRIAETPFYNKDLTKISEATKELLIYCAVDTKRTIIFGDHFRRPWVYVFDRDFIEERLTAVNEYSAPILKRLLFLVEPEFELNKSEINALNLLINCVFGANTETENSSKEKVDKIYTTLDLLKKIKKTNNMEVENREENMENTKVSYGVWNIIPDDETHEWKSCPLGRLPWE